MDCMKLFDRFPQKPSKIQQNENIITILFSKQYYHFTTVTKYLSNVWWCI